MPEPIVAALAAAISALLLAIISGALVPWRTMRELRRADRELLTEAKAALAIERERADTLTAQVGELLEHSRTSSAMMTAIRDHIAGREGGT